MILRETPLAGAHLIEPERFHDDRGHFARTFDAERFAAAGLDALVVECSTSFNPLAETLRGMHYQADPHGEAKLIRVTRGAVLNVIVDLRRDSGTFRQWFGVELDAASGQALYAPAGFAHGFKTLVADTEVHYQMSYRYAQDAARGVRFDDPAFAIKWPLPPRERVMSKRDRSRRDFAA